MSKKKVKKIELPLVKQLENIDLFDKTNSFQEIPPYISDNLKHKLRPYQQKALMDLDWTQRQSEVDQRYNHLLFNMATGSGKTDVMAAVILYMYREFHYQNFLFVVNTNAVISKTIENLLNSNSPKYLYRPLITIDGLHVQINGVQKFPTNPTDGNIYLRLTTAQTLTNELNSPRENGLTYDELEQQKLVILADEAHHFSASTKARKSKQEQLNTSWENTLDRIRQCNIENRQFEFTATIDLQNETVYQKYRDKVIFKYDLSRFIDDGYSKKVFRLQANNDDHDKMLNAVLLSQYRKRIAKNMKIPDFKPIILFKSNKISVSNQTRDDFVMMINNLNVDQLQKFIQRELQSTQSAVLQQTYEYWLKQDIAQLVTELKRDFDQRKLINVNDSAKEGILGDPNDLDSLNTLESPNNPFRVVFAVAKLSEGWDVLNLYDIVRIGEQPITPNQTNSEAQLIGRGARYNPFIYKNNKSYTRRFDNQSVQKQLLERLYYHTINEPKYLDNLRNSLNKIDLQVEEDDNDFDVLTTTVKSSFIKSKAYRQGNVYYNEVEKVPPESYSSIKAYGIDPDKIAEVNMVDASIEAEYRSRLNIESMVTSLQRVISFKDLSDYPIIKKAFSRNKFYRFNELHKYVPKIDSMKEFINDDKWLGNIRLYARVAQNSKELTPEQKLRALDKYLENVQKKITNNYRKNRGTNKFKPMAINEVVADYQKKISHSFNKQMSEIISVYPMKKQSWYVYEDAIVDKLEKSMIDVIGAFVSELKGRYDEVYLIRIDERNSTFKLHDFDSSMYHYEGFMPDFILYLSDQDFSYQIYVEPKGDQLLERDQWKENLLENINPENIIILGEDDNVKLYGVKFFVQGDKRNVIDEMKEKLDQ